MKFLGTGSSPVQLPQRRQPQQPKKQSRKWSATEVEQLVTAINAVSCSTDSINWAQIAQAVQGRTGKQCREKYKNDLRPDLCKDPWTNREEYILARVHSVAGNQWAEIARFLPGRSENTIKNKWNATLRSKADVRSNTLLWMYARVVLEQGKSTSLDTFMRACAAFASHNPPGTLEGMQVPEEYFKSGPSGEGEGQGGEGAGPAKPKASALQTAERRQVLRTKPKRRARWDSSSEEEEGDEDMSDSESEEDEGHRAKRRYGTRASAAATLQPQQQQTQQQQQAQPHGPVLDIPPHVMAALLEAQLGVPSAPHSLPAAPPGLPLHSALLPSSEATATIKLCAPKHTQKGPAASPAPCPGQENQPPASAAGPFSLMPPPQPSPAPGMPAHTGSPALGCGRAAWHAHAAANLLSPGLPADGDYMDFLKTIGLESVLSEFGCSPAAIRVCRARQSDASEQPLPQSTGCPRPPRHSWLPDLEPLAPTQPQPATQGGLLQPQPTPLGGLQPSASQQAGAGAGRGPCCQTPHYPSPRSYPGYAAGLLSPMAVPGLPQLDPAPTCHRLSGCTAASPRSAHPHHHHALCGLLSPGGLPPLPPGFLL